MIGQTVGSRYAIGVYGNGLVNRILREEKLVSYNWISASRSHEETVDFYNSGQWHLFQNQVDRRWFGPLGKCANGLDVDMNLQNPKVSSIGAWGAGEVGISRNQKISYQRRFATVQRRSLGKRRRRWEPSWLQIRHSRAAKCQCRILVQSGASSSVDIDEDGNADGLVRTSDLTSNLATMPPWGPSSYGERGRYAPWFRLRYRLGNCCNSWWEPSAPLGAFLYVSCAAARWSLLMLWTAPPPARECHECGCC